ncbi:uncharacterized protein LOC120835183 isoform X4 [Gasterosteus aculeatus]
MAGRLLFVTLMYSCANTKTQARPQLIMNSAVISETETVTLDCRAPSYPTVHQCYFTIIGAKHAKGFTCVQTLTGTELLRMSDQKAPAEVKVDCYYTVMVGDVYHPSAHSVTSSITIQNVVKSSTTQTKTASAVTTAGLCASRPVTTVKQTSAGLSASRPVTRIKQTPADQTFGPRNSGSFSSPPLTTDKPTSDVVESSTTQTKPASTVTTAGLSASTPVTRIKQTSDQTFGPRNSGSFSSPPLTTDKPTSEISSYRRSQADVTGSVKLEEQTLTHENHAMFQIYANIPNEPPASAKQDAV